jgi:hypothetical protein
MVLESNTLDVLFVKDGQQGEDGKVLYTWIKYAKDANGTGMTDDPNGAIYIGISYNNESSIESNDPTQYAWTKIQGADGKKGEDAYTIFLENENISFATDKNRNPLSEQAYTSGITIMKGAKPVTDFTIGDIVKTQGIAVAKTDTAIAISVVNGNPLPNDSGEIEIPITVGGTVFKKILTWTCAKKGEQGEKGEQGIQGPQGEQGIAGKDGTSVTITNKSITYQLSTSGTTIPTGTWQTTPQAIPEGQYQWTKTSVTYSDGNKTESYSISYHGKNGSDGTSVKTTSTSVKYQVGDSGTTKPTGTWQSNVPTVAQGKYLWTQTIVNYSDGNSTESYSVSYKGIDGSNGVNGMNAATIYLYQRATSTPSKPSNTLTYTFSTTKISGTLNNGWSTAIPTGTDAVYVTVASVSSKNDTATIATSAWSAPVVLAQNGKTGSDGKAGLNVATIYLYQRNTSKPSKPSASVTYTFSTGVASGLNNGWSQKIPDGTNPLYVTLATASSNTATDTILSSEWSDVVVMAQNGEDGQDGISPKVSLSKSGDTTTISIVDATGTHTQTVKDGTNGTPGAAGKDGKTSYFHVKYSNDGGKTFTANSGEDTGIYMGSYTDYTEADSTDVKKYNWVKVKGDKGDTGQKGKDGTSIKITSKSVTYQTSTSGTTAPTGTWSTTVPTVNNGQYLWTKTTVQYSDGNKTEAYSVSYKGTNGTNGTSVTVSKTEVTYQVSTSGTNAPTGTWSTTMPSCDQGQYLWTKTYVKYSDGKDTTSYSVSYKGVDGEKFAFNMLRETNQGSKHWVNIGASGKYSVESITTEDSINAVKLICTEPIASNEWQFCDFSDYEMLKSLKASTTYTLSYDIKANRSGKILHNIKTGGGQKVFFANDIACKVLGNETWEHVSLKMTSGTTLPNLDGQVIYMFGDALSKVGYSIIKNLKLTEGIVDTPWAPHPEDLEGRGVSETVQYYLATSQASGVTSSTSGWSTDITTQKLTADKKYLWNCYQTKYSDGTSEPISTPKVIGVYGDKGTSTKIIRTSYEYTQTNIDKFSTSGYSGVWGVNDATTGLKVGDSVLLKVKNTTKGSDCLIFANITAIPSNYSLTCTSYGVIDNGSDGQDGAGFHWNLLKYSGDLSKQVLGGAGTYTATVESIEDKTTPSGQAEKITYTVQGTGGKFIQTGKYIKEGDIKQGKTYTVSVWCKCSSIKSTGVINAEFLDNKTYVNPTLSTEWQQYVVTGVANKDVTSTSSASAISFYYNDNMSVGDIFYISSPKVEEGDKASPWCTTYEETLAKNLTITPSSQYFKSTDGGKTFAPNTITIKPTIQGEISFGKWQYSIDGGVSFADVVSGQKGLAVSNNVLTVSKDSSLYSDAVTMITFRAVADDSSFYDTCSIAKIYDVSDIGDGRNLLWNSNFAKTDEAITGTTNSWGLHTRGTNLVASIDTSTKHNGFNTLKTVSAANGDKNSSNDLEWFAWGISERTSDNLHSKNQNYTLSFYAKASVTTDFIVRWGYDAYGADTTRTLTTNWQKYEIKLHQATSAYSITIIFKLLTAGTVWFSEFKLEKGSSATGYSTAPEDLQTAILSTKSEISDVSLKVDNNKQAIEQRVEKTTYEQDLKLVKGDISKANEGLNKWRYEIYPKSLFASEYQGKSTMDVFAKNTNLTPSQSVLINDTDLSIAWNYDNNYIGYALTFAKFSAAKSVAITFAHDDGAHIYLNGKLIGGSDAYSQTGESLTLGFVKGWNCIEVIVNEGASTEGFKLGTTISAISECQLMNCYYGTPVARQSHITNQLVENTTNIKGISTKVSKVTSVIGENGENFTSFKNDYSDFKQTMNGFKTTVGQTYTTKDDFNGLEIGGRNLVRLGGLSGNGATSFSYDKTTDTYTIVSPVVSTVWGTGAAVKYDDNHKVLIPYGKTYILSFEVKVPQALSINIDINNYAVSGSSWAGNDNDDGSTRGQSSYSIPANTWTKVWVRWANTNTKNTNKVDLYDNSSIRLVTKDCTSAVTWQIRHVKGELGNKPTDWTPAPEDVNGKIVNVETIANQTAKKFEWIVKGGDSSSNFTLTDRVADLVAERINFKGLVTFSGTTNLIENSNMMNGLANITSECKAIKVIDDSTYRKALVITPIAGGRIFWGVANVWKANITYTVSFVAKSSVAGQKIKPSRSVADWGDEITLTTSYVKYTTRIKSTATADGGTLSFSFSNAIGDVTLTNVKLETGMNPTDWAPAPGDYITQASLVRNWTTNTTWINGGKIYTGSITADKIATDAIKSRNYISSGGTQGSFLNLSDGSFTSPNLSWDANGNLIAKNANLSGQITATKGSIGGWSVDNYSIYTTYDADQNIFGSGISGTKGKYVLWAGETNNAIGANRSSDTPTDASLVIYNNGGLEVRKTMVGNDKKNHLYTTILQSGQINLKMDDNYIGTITATDTISSNSTVTMSHVSMAAKKGYGWSILHTDDSGNLISDIQRDPGDTKIKIRSPITVSSTDITKYNAIETTGDVVVNGKIHANYGPNRIQFNPDNNGSIELYGGMPFIDFHFACSNADYTSRIISQHDWDCLTFTGSILLGGTIYNSSGGHYTWDGKDDAYISCGNYSGGNNIYYYANYHAFYVNNDSGSGMMYINTNGVTSRVGFTKTSDERIKKNFESFDDNIIDAYMNIEPVKYQLKQSSNDNYHFGFKAQHVDKVFSDYGDIYNESFDICTSRPIDPDKAKELYGVDGMVEEYGLRYDELIAPTTYMVQHIYKELEQVRQEKADLEARLQAIEAKLGF